MAKPVQKDNAQYKLFVYYNGKEVMKFGWSPWLAAVRSLGEFMKNAEHDSLYTKLVIMADYGPNSKEEEDWEIVWEAK